MMLEVFGVIALLLRALDRGAYGADVSFSRSWRPARRNDAIVFQTQQSSHP